MKKKAFVLILASMLMVFVLAACDGDINVPNSENSPPPATTPNDNTPVTTPEAGGATLQGGQNERLPLEIIETGYGFATWSESSLSYGIVLYNPNSEALEFPSFRVTARRENNSIIGTDDKVLSIIYPGQTLTIADMPSFRVIPDEVYSVEFEVLEPSDWNWTTGDFIELEAINLHLASTARDGYNVTGEIRNPNDRAFDSLRLNMILRDSNGHIVGGDYSFTDRLSANGSVPFQMGVRDSILQNIEGEWEVEIHASPW
jgi:hypothetical protein